MQVAQGLFGLPSTVIDPVLGHSLTSAQETILKGMIPANVAFGLQECLKRCNISRLGTTVSLDEIARLSKHTHITGYAYAVFVALMLIFFGILHILEKSRSNSVSSFYLWSQRYLMYAPTLFGPHQENKTNHRNTTNSAREPDHSKIWNGLALPPRGDIILICFFWAVNLALVLWDVNRDDPRRRIFQRLGWLGVWNAITAVILALKVSPLPSILGKSHDGLVFYHKWIGITAFIEVWIHSLWGMWVVKDYYVDHVFRWHSQQTGAWIATLAFTLLVIVAWSPWFVGKHFETFLVLHVAGYVGLLVGLWIHNQLLKWYVVVLIALWSIDRLARLAFLLYLRGVHKQYATLFNSSQSTKVIFPRRQKWSAGSHIYINFPDCKPLQSHPYTIASIADDTKSMQEVALLIQKSSSGEHGFSNQLYELVYSKGQICELPFVYHGPYGAAPDINRYTRVLCIGGGSGITMPYALTQSFLTTPGQNPRACTLVWCSREIADFTAFDLSKMKQTGAHIYLFQTRTTEGMSVFQTLLKKLEGVKDAMMPDTMNHGKVTELEEGYDTHEVNQKLKDPKEGLTSISVIKPDQQYRSRPVEIYADEMEKVLQPRSRTNDQYTSDMERAIGITTAVVPSSSVVDGRGSVSKKALPIVVQATDRATSHSPTASHEDDFADSTESEYAPSGFSSLKTIPAHEYYGHRSPSQITDTAARIAIVRAHTSFSLAEQEVPREQPRRTTQQDPRKTHEEDFTGTDTDDIQFSSASAKIVRLQREFGAIGKGRPVWSDILETFLADATADDRLCVVVCGGVSMCREVRNAVAQCPRFLKIDLHVEQFG